ncbi:uncharacterized protein [Apostichopus japonicus]|uniref:uncharacterized protein isoform X1 n=1 Tax=Stichopus japonicus TaxID=307972 RepID=UPI003AB35C80
MVFYTILCLCGFLGLTEGVSTSVQNITVVRGNSVFLNCSSKNNSSYKPVWWFQQEVIYADGLTSETVDNVYGEVANTTFSYLKITNFYSGNAGNYTCAFGNVTVKTYLLDMKGVSTSVQNITVVRGNSLFLNCSGKNKFSRKPVWWFQRKVFYADGLPPEMVDNVYGEVTNTTFSYLKITNFYSGNAGNYTCAFGNVTVKTYLLDMKGVSTAVQNITVARGNSLFLNCSSKNNSSRKPVWWFQRKVFYADGLPPEMVDNVYGEVTNTTFSYLKITNFYSGNAGNYTCAFGNVTSKTYLLDMKGVSTSVQNITVVRGNSLFLNCSEKINSSRKPVWWFQRKVFYADGLPPELVDNVYGEVTNTTFSYLKITNFYSGNAGNYTCAFGNVTMKTYLLDMKDPTITLLCNSVMCPSFLDVNELTDQSFQCYSDQTPLQRNLTWKINDETPSSDKAKYKLIGLDIDVISTLNITLSKDDIIISCTLGNTSKSVALRVATYGTKEFLIFAISTSGAIFVVFVVTVCMIAICKTRFKI